MVLVVAVDLEEGEEDPDYGQPENQVEDHRERGQHQKEGHEQDDQGQQDGGERVAEQMPHMLMVRWWGGDGYRRFSREIELGIWRGSR